MIRVNIESKKHGKVWRDFETDLEAQAWVDQCKYTQHWGRNAYEAPVSSIPADEIPPGAEIIPAEIATAIDDDGEEMETVIREAQVVMPAEWSYSFEAIEPEAKQSEADALKAIDWSKVTTIAALKEVVKQIIEKV